MSILFSSVAALAQLHLDTSYPSPDTARVAVTGEVDLATSAALHSRLLAVLHGQAPAVLEVDLAGVTFLDCTGVSRSSQYATPPLTPAVNAVANRSPSCVGCWI